jgi:hypothetical protein
LFGLSFLSSRASEVLLKSCHVKLSSLNEKRALHVLKNLHLPVVDGVAKAV